MTKTRTAAATDLRSKFRQIYDTLSASLIEREDMLHGAIIALLARELMFVGGPPGTGKSLTVELLADSISGIGYFEWLMDKFTKPEDLFGVYSIPEMKQGTYRRVTIGRLPEADVAFLDEIWKATGSNLNVLLRMTDGSRRFYNPEPIRTPLMTLYGASNELPENGELNALWDRFMLRYWVTGIQDSSSFKQMMMIKGFNIQSVITKAELIEAQQEVANLHTPEAIFDQLVDLKARLAQQGLEFSDRRWRTLGGVLRANAWFAGRAEVGLEDFGVLQHVLWDRPDQQKAVRATVMGLVAPEMTAALKLYDQAAEVKDDALTAASAEAGFEALNKLKQISSDLEALPQSGDIQKLTKKVAEWKRSVSRKCLGLDV